MNILELIVIVVAALFAFSGFRKGFVKKLAAMVSLVLSVVLVSAFLPYITQFLKDSTPVYTFIVGECREVVEEQAAKGLLAGTQAGDRTGLGIAILSVALGKLTGSVIYFTQRVFL